MVRKRSALQTRLVDIYKRGPMHTTEAFLSARTFAELVGRYKYLHEIALHDRSVVKQVTSLHDKIDEQRTLLVRLQTEIERNRLEKQRRRRGCGRCRASASVRSPMCSSRRRRCASDCSASSATNLANGYHELVDATEQRERFGRDLATRQKRAAVQPPVDERLLTGLAKLPACSGVAMGVDRLLMAMLGTEKIGDVIAFPFDRA